MVNSAHFAILQEALDKKDISIWNNWRDQNANIKSSLYEVDLSGVNLRAANLHGANLKAANLINANLNGANLDGANLKAANLINVNLNAANLNRANLNAANLSGVNLITANLINTNLANTNLSAGNLINANLSVANLINANLSDVNFSAANLSATNLSNSFLNETILKQTRFYSTDFENARLNAITFSDVDLSTIKNLDKAHVQGPCTIGIDTLYKSESLLKEDWFLDFLRDCGVPETMVTYASSLVVKPIDYYSCFISYSSENEDFAKLLYDTLRGARIRVWYAPEQILPGHNIKQELIRGIQHWDKVILCCSKSSLTEKWWVDFERSIANHKARKLKADYKQSIPVMIPLDLDGYIFDDYQNHPDHDPFLLDYHIADFTDWKNHDSFKREVNRLIRALQTDDGREPPPEPRL